MKSFSLLIASVLLLCCTFAKRSLTIGSNLSKSKRSAPRKLVGGAYGPFNPYLSTMGLTSSGFVNPYSMNPYTLSMMGSTGMSPYSGIGGMGMGMSPYMGSYVGGMGMSPYMGSMDMGMSPYMGGMAGFGGVSSLGISPYLANPVNQMGIGGAQVYNNMSLMGGQGMNPTMLGMSMGTQMGGLNGLMNPFMMGGYTPYIANANVNVSQRALKLPGKKDAKAETIVTQEEHQAVQSNEKVTEASNQSDEKVAESSNKITVA